ncbi:MAG: hypothetical protein AAB370_10740 [Verrucomicrobiota bacterium]
MLSLEKQVAELKIKLARARNRADYWRRRVVNPDYDAARKARWRRDNPAKYDFELFKNRLRAKLRGLP